MRALVSHQYSPGSIPARRYMWVEGIVGSCLAGCEGACVSPGSPVFLPPKKLSVNA